MSVFPVPPDNWFGHPRWQAGAALLLALLCLISYGPSLRGDFIWDDRDLIVDNPYIQNTDLLTDALVSDFWVVMEDPSRFRNFYRPMAIVTYFFDYQLWGSAPAGFHATNLLLHLGCTLLVLLVGSRLLRSPGAALASAALFAVHPIHTESVCWISGRTDLLAAIFMLGATWCYLQLVAGVRPSLHLALSSLLFLLALLSKEVSIVLPLALFFHWRFTSRTSNPRAYPVVAVMALVLIAGFYLLARVVILEMPVLLPGPVSSWILLYNLPLLLGWYLIKLVAPIGFDAHVGLQWAGLEIWPKVAAITLVLLVLATLVTRLGKKDPTASFSGAWFLVFLLPVMNAGSFTDVLVAERFLYVPSIGICWLLGSLLGWLSTAKVPGRWLQFAAVALVAGAALATWQRSRLWGDELAFLEEMAAGSDGSPLPHTLLGQAYLRHEDAERAVTAFQAALRRSPGNCLLMNLISLSFLNLGVQTRSGATLDQGFEMTKLAIEQCPQSDVLYNTLGEYYMRQRDPVAALEQFQEALRMNPERAGYHYNVGALLIRLRRPNEAKPRLEHYIQRAPDGELKDQALRWLAEM